LFAFGVVWIVVDVVILRQIGLEFPMRKWSGIFSGALLTAFTLIALGVVYFQKLQNKWHRRSKNNGGSNNDNRQEVLIPSDNEFF